jgi:hypothetical protein
MKNSNITPAGLSTIVFSALAIMSLAACSEYTPSAEQVQANQQQDISKRAVEEVGIYTPTHFTRKRLANRIGQLLDDPNYATVSYAQGMDGRLTCIGHTIGYPMPGATQTTAPQRLATSAETLYRDDMLVPQPEPDQLYYPASVDATWILLINQKTGQAEPVYFEGHVQTFPQGVKPDPALIARDCSQ